MNGLDFKKEIWDLLRTVQECMGQAFCPIVEKYGLTMMQTRVLIEIKQGKNSTVGSMASVIGLTSGNASSLCKKLEKAGFVKRQRDPQDERYVDLVLTEKGAETIRQIEKTLDQRYGPFFAGKTDQDLLELIAGIKRLTSFIQEMCELETSHRPCQQSALIKAD